MNNLKARLDIVRDKILGKRKGLKFDPISLDEIAEGEFNAGFSACSSILLPMVLEMRDALGWIMKNSFVSSIHHVQAREALKNLEAKIKEIEK